MSVDEGDFNANDQESLWRRRDVPENEAPVSVAFDAILARNDDAAVFLSGLQVFRNGVRFAIEVRTRSRLFAGSDLRSALHEQGPTVLLLGVELADGRRCTRDHRRVSDATEPILRAQGGSGGERSAELGLFLSPVPPAGATKMLCAWPWLGLREQLTLLPTDRMLAAAASVIEFWPSETASQPSRHSIARPDLPDDSWFSST